MFEFFTRLPKVKGDQKMKINLIRIGRKEKRKKKKESRPAVAVSSSTLFTQGDYSKGKHTMSKNKVKINLVYDGVTCNIRYSGKVSKVRNISCYLLTWS